VDELYLVRKQSDSRVQACECEGCGRRIPLMGVPSITCTMVPAVIPQSSVEAER
jgi:hypothetical protein